MSKPTITPPTRVMPWAEFYEKTDDANKLMDRVWYCIASTDEAAAKQKVFWEHWYWDKGDIDKELQQKKCCNHTLTIDPEGKEVDYPIWPVRFSKDQNKEFMKMYPAIDCKCFVATPFGLGMTPIQFPTNDSPEEFRVDYCALPFGNKLYFIFTLDPHISEENKKKCFDRLEQENGVKREWFHKIQWDDDYKIGSTGEPDINPKK